MFTYTGISHLYITPDFSLYPVLNSIARIVLFVVASALLSTSDAVGLLNPIPPIGDLQCTERAVSIIADSNTPQNVGLMQLCKLSQSLTIPSMCCGLDDTMCRQWDHPRKRIAIWGFDFLCVQI